MSDVFNNAFPETGGGGGTTITITGRVFTDGTIDPVYLGDDDDGDYALLLKVTDADEALYDLLTDASVSSIIFGAGRCSSANQITGTITKADIVVGTGDDAGKTIIPIAIPAASKTGSPGEYEAHIKAVDSSGKEQVRWTGCLTLYPERAAV